MKTSLKVTILTLAIAIPAFLLGAGSPQGYTFWAAIWPFAAAEPVVEVSGAQVPLFMLFGVFEAVALGLAVSFLVWGGALVRKVGGPNKTRNTLFMVAGAWVLGNWWVHDSLHIVNGHNAWGLLILEYVFHVTLMAAGAYAAWYLIGALRPAATAQPAPEAAPAPAAAVTRATK